MGGATSKPTQLNRRELLLLTQKPRDFVNQLFQVMIDKLTPKELHNMSLTHLAMCGALMLTDKNYLLAAYQLA